MAYNPETRTNCKIPLVTTEVFIMQKYFCRNLYPVINLIYKMVKETLQEYYLVSG